jgi:hypothetical protein
LLTPNNGFDSAAVNYGQLPRDLDTAVAGACPIVASYGRRDPTLRGAASRLDDALTRAGIEHNVKEYPEASHAFLNDTEAGPRFLRPLLCVGASVQNRIRPRTPGSESSCFSPLTCRGNHVMNGEKPLREMLRTAAAPNRVGVILMLTVTDLAQVVRAGDLDPVTVTEYALARSLSAHHDQAAVYRQQLPGDEGRTRAGQKNQYWPDVSRGIT